MEMDLPEGMQVHCQMLLHQRKWLMILPLK